MSHLPALLSILIALAIAHFVVALVAFGMIYRVIRKMRAAHDATRVRVDAGLNRGARFTRRFGA